MRKIFLTDNGSLRPASILNLRSVARRLSEMSGFDVTPASLLHSSKIDPSELDGEPAMTLGPAIRQAAMEGVKRFLVLPFFFGPSRAITDYLPRRITEMQKTIEGLDVRIAKPLFDPEGTVDLRIARILEEQVMHCRPAGDSPTVILVDHGSPEPDVTMVRNVLAGQLSVLLQNEVSRVVPASMERREGDEYDFSGPLLKDVLDRAAEWDLPVIVSMLFLSPGRHAGPDGDVAVICRESEERNPGLKTIISGLVGEQDAIVPILADRLREAMRESRT